MLGAGEGVNGPRGLARARGSGDGVASGPGVRSAREGERTRAARWRVGAPAGRRWAASWAGGAKGTAKSCETGGAAGTGVAAKAGSSVSTKVTLCKMVTLQEVGQ